MQEIARRYAFYANAKTEMLLIHVPIQINF